MGLSYLNNEIVKNSKHVSSFQHQKGQRGVLKLRDGIKKSDKLQLLTRTCIKPTNKLVSSLSGTPLMLRQTTNSRLTKLTTAWTQGKPPPSPIQYSLRFSVAPTFKWFFVPGFPRKNPEIVLVWTPKTLRDHNSLVKPLIRIRSTANLQLSSRTFQWCVAFHLHALGSDRFLTFSGRKSNCQFDSRPFFLP